MDRSNLIIFKFTILYQILKELEENINFNIFEAPNEKALNDYRSNFKNYLIINTKNSENYNMQLTLNKFPIKIFEFIEKVNIILIKSQFNEKSELLIGKYELNLNSRELSEKNMKLKLTEKEANIVFFLFNSKKTISVNELQSKVWDHKSLLETHTVETHIYRLRKKIKEKFNDENFIISSKEGYSIN